jgi:hypothetical protein
MLRATVMGMVGPIQLGRIEAVEDHDLTRHCHPPLTK